MYLANFNYQLLLCHSPQRSVILLNKKFHAESAKKQRSPRRRPVANAARNIMVAIKANNRYWERCNGSKIVVIHPGKKNYFIT